LSAIHYFYLINSTPALKANKVEAKRTTKANAIGKKTFHPKRIN
jgi:hypothetical protein